MPEPGSYDGYPDVSARVRTDGWSAAGLTYAGGAGGDPTQEGEDRETSLALVRLAGMNHLVVAGAILSTLSLSPLLVVTYRAPSGPDRAARSRP